MTLTDRQRTDRLRKRLTELTYVPPTLELPSDVDDPELDPEDPDASDIPGGPTELVPTPAVPAAPPVTAGAQPSKADVGWLVSDLRNRYRKEASL